MDESQVCSERESEVNSEMKKLVKGVEACLQLCASLEQKLTPVLRPTPPIADIQNKKTTAIPVPLVLRLSSENDKLEIIIMSLDSLLNRIEV